MFSPHLFFFPSHLSSQLTFLPEHKFPQVFPSTKLSSINHDSHLHLSGFRPLRKILTVDHYLHNQDFQHVPCRPHPFPAFLNSPLPSTPPALNQNVSPCGARCPAQRRPSFTQATPDGLQIAVPPRPGLLAVPPLGPAAPPDGWEHW